MATFSRVKIWVSNEVLTAAALNAEFDNILNNMTPTGIEDASANVSAMQASTSPGGLGTESLATSLLGELQRLRYVISRFVNIDLSQKWYESATRSFANLVVATADIVDAAVTTIKIADLNVTTGKLADLAVTTAKLAAASVTRAKVEATNFVLSPSCGSFSINATTYADVTNLSCSITTVGRPVRVEIVPTYNAAVPSEATLGLALAASSPGIGYIKILRDAVVIMEHASVVTPSDNSFFVPVWLPSVVDDVAAGGPYVYKVQIKTNSTAASLAFDELKLRVTEEI